jgi:hypothetical protein
MVLNLESVLACVLGIGGGVHLFLQGFRELKSSRTIQNIPTSRIMTGAVGTNVEIKGEILASAENLLSAPISGQPSAFYSLEIQKLVRSKNNNYWKKIDQVYSSKEFCVDDKSGALAQVFIEGAEIQRQGRVEEFQIRSDNILSMPERLISVLQQNEEKLKVFKLKNSSGLFSQNYRFVEWCFHPGESVYILGYAESGIKPLKRNKLKFAQFLQAKKMIENDPLLQTRFDRNQDGFLDVGELEMGAQTVGVGLQTKPVPIHEKEHAQPVKMNFKKRKGFTFLISNIKEKDLVRKLSIKAAFKVWGGPAVAIGSAVYLIYMLNIKI